MSSSVDVVDFHERPFIRNYEGTSMASSAVTIRKAIFTRLTLGLLSAASLSQACFGQATGNTGTNNASAAAGVAGIDISPDGVLSVRQFDPELVAAQRAAALQGRNPKDVKSSPLRKVSLQRLEKVVQQTMLEGRDFSQEIETVAGLTRIQYVIYLPGSKDIVLAGPAEETIQSEDGRWIGLLSGHPTMRIDDLALTLRTFAPGNSKTDWISCSIDPTQEGLSRMQSYLKQLGGSISPDANAFAIAEGMKNALGLQTVSIHGIPASTRFAQTLVEADYRMKMIGIGLEKPAVAMKSWVDRANPSSGSANAMQRWYFMADYQGVKVSPDGSVLKLVGQGVKLVGEDERVDRTGKRTKTGKGGDPASKAFTKDFTDKFEQIANVTPVFYDMRNLIDLSVCAAFIQRQDFYSQSGWDLGCFGDEKRFEVEVAKTPSNVETAVNAIWRGSRLMTPIGGGVHISARKLASPENTQADSALVDTQTAASAPANLAENQWWWD
jgi:hypothetical protein